MVYGVNTSDDTIVWFFSANISFLFSFSFFIFLILSSPVFSNCFGKGGRIFVPDSGGSFLFHFVYNLKLMSMEVQSLF